MELILWPKQSVLLEMEVKMVVLQEKGLTWILLLKLCSRTNILTLCMDVIRQLLAAYNTFKRLLQQKYITPCQKQVPCNTFQEVSTAQSSSLKHHVSSLYSFQYEYIGYTRLVCFNTGIVKLLKTIPSNYLNRNQLYRRRNISTHVTEVVKFDSAWFVI